MDKIDTNYLRHVVDGDIDWEADTIRELCEEVDRLNAENNALRNNCYDSRFVKSGRL